MPPGYFGEGVLLSDHKNGMSKELASVVADTRVDVLALHMKTIDQNLLTAKFREYVRRNSPMSPPNRQLVLRFAETERWEAFRTKIIEHIPKDKWPVPAHLIKRRIDGAEIILEDMVER